MANPICWIEFMTKDLPKAREFYGKLFDWKFSPSHMDGYDTFTPGEGHVGGGFSTFGDEGTPQHIVYIQVDDIDAKLAQIVAAGGTIKHEKQAIGESMGFVAHFSDPHGNRVGLWSEKG